MIRIEYAGFRILAMQASNILTYWLLGMWIGLSFDWRFAFGAALLSGLWESDRLFRAVNGRSKIAETTARLEQGL